MEFERTNRGFSSVELSNCKIKSGAGGHSLVIEDSELDDGRCTIKAKIKLPTGEKVVIRQSRVRNGKSGRIKLAQKHQPKPKLLSVKIKFRNGLSPTSMDDDNEPVFMDLSTSSVSAGDNEKIESVLSIQSGNAFLDFQSFPAAGKGVRFGVRINAGNFAKKVSATISCDFCEVKGGKTGLEADFTWWKGTGRVTFLKAGSGTVLAGFTVIRPDGDAEIFSVTQDFVVRETP